MKVYLSELAEEKLIILSDYLLAHWNLETKDRFIKKLTNKINQISKQPESCPQSASFKGLFKCVVTKQTTFYYRVNHELKEIEIITIFDSRQNPSKLSKEVE